VDEDSDCLFGNFVLPAASFLSFNAPSALRESTGEAVARVYLLYEQALSERNSIDFNGLILGACRLFRDMAGVAERTRRTYPYWLIDEFQDTSSAQYRLIQLVAGDSFKNVFAVADDDQIISPESVSLRLFDTDAAESEGIAAEIAHGDLATWGETAVLGRTRSLLVPFSRR
jgi:hypothetical protein